MSREEPPSYLFTSGDDRTRRRAVARARAHRQRRVALLLLLLAFAGAAFGAWAAFGRRSGSETLHVGAGRTTTARRAEALGTTTVRGSIPNEPLATTSTTTTA